MSAPSVWPQACGTTRERRPFAALYDRMTDSLEHAVLGERRASLLADLAGEVLDVGAGTGKSLRYFRSASRLVAAEPDAASRKRMAAKLAGASVPVELTGDTAEELQQPRCQLRCRGIHPGSVTDPDRVLAEARRVLRPGGELRPVSRSSGRNCFDPFPRWVPARLMLQAVAVPAT